MSNQIVNFTINLDGNAYTGFAQLDKALGHVIVNAKKSQTLFDKIGDAVGAYSLKIDAFSNVVEKVSGAFDVLVGTSLDFEQQANLQMLLNSDAQATERLLTQIREYGKATVYDRSGENILIFRLY